MSVTPDTFATMIILDWDCTLFPTDWAIKNMIDINNPLYKERYIDFFKELDKVLSAFLYTTLQYGKVIIVTNAMTKWISICCDVLPNTRRIINKYIDVISARDIYQKKYPGNGYEWKKLTFQELMVEYFAGKQLHQNIISIGDADYEFKALLDLYKEFRHKKRFLKAIRMMQNPDYDQIIEQLVLLNSSFNLIYKKYRHMDLIFKDKHSKIKKLKGHKKAKKPIRMSVPWT